MMAEGQMVKEQHEEQIIRCVLPRGCLPPRSIALLSIETSLLKGCARSIRARSRG